MTKIRLAVELGDSHSGWMRTRTIVLLGSITLATVATVVACTGDTASTEATSDAGGHDSGNGNNTTDGSVFQVDSGTTPMDSGGQPMDAGFVPDAAPLDPSSLGSRLVLWLSADSNYTTDGGFAVWKDRSSAGNDAVQANGANIPALFDGGTGVNGKPALHFTGTEYLTIADSDSLQWAASDFTFFMVERHTNDTNLYGLLYAKWTDNGADGYPGFFLWADYPGNSAIVTRLDIPNAVFGDAGTNDGVARVVGARRNGTDLQLWEQAQLAGEMPDSSIVNPTEFNAAGLPAYIGGRPANVQALLGDIAEVIAVKGTVTDQELVNLQAYLRAKYKL